MNILKGKNNNWGPVLHSESKPQEATVWQTVYANVHLSTAINSALVTEVFPGRILPHWMQSIKKLWEIGFDSWNWEKQKGLPFRRVFAVILPGHSVHVNERLLFPTYFFFVICLLQVLGEGWGNSAKMIIPQVLILFLQDNKWEWRGVK